MCILVSTSCKSTITSQKSGVGCIAAPQAQPVIHSMVVDHLSAAQSEDQHEAVLVGDVMI